MKFSSLIFSPLDQFEILPILSLNLGFADFTITNVNVILALIFFFFNVSLFFNDKHTLFYIFNTIK